MERLYRHVKRQESKEERLYRKQKRQESKEKRQEARGRGRISAGESGKQAEEAG